MKPPSYLTTLVKITKDTGIAGFGELFYIITAYITNILISRFLGAEGIGIYAQAITILMLILLLARSGFDGGVLRFISQYLARYDFAHIKGMNVFTTWLVLITGIIWSAGLFVSASTLANNILHEPQLVFILRMLALTIPFSALTGIWLNNIQAFQHIEYRVYLERLYSPLMTAGSIWAFLLLGWQWNGIISGTLLATVSGSILTYFTWRSLWSPLVRAEKIDSQLEIKKWIQFCYPLLFSGVIAFVIARMSTLLLGHFRVSTEVGIYEIALKVALMVELPLTVSNFVFAPVIGEIYSQGDLNKLQSLFKTVTKWVLTMSLLIFMIAVLLAQPILKLFGPEFEVGIPTLWILGFSQLVNAGTGAVGWILIMSGYSKLHLFNSFSSALLTIAFGFLLIPPYGMIGAAITVGVSLAVVNITRLAQVYYLLGIHPYRWDFVKPVGAGLITMTSVYLFQQINWLPANFPTHILILGIIVALYFSALILFKLHQDEKDLLNLVRQKISNNRLKGI